MRQNFVCFNKPPWNISSPLDADFKAFVVPLRARGTRGSADHILTRSLLGLLSPFRNIVSELAPSTIGCTSLYFLEFPWVEKHEAINTSKSLKHRLLDVGHSI